jgi:hypothetical protein
MNIKLKAGLEVTGLVIAAVAVASVVRLVLTTATEAYGIEAVLNAMAFVFVSVAAYVCVGLLYDMRVAQIAYKQKLADMVDGK